MPVDAGHYKKGPEVLVVSLAARGDRAAFSELVRRRQSWVRNLMRRLSGDPNLADDLTQQIFLKAWRKIRQLRRPDRFGSWLRQVAINEWLQQARKRDALEDARSDDDVVIATTDKTSLGMDLDRVLASLPGPVSLCVVLAYHERMTHDEIAAMTGLPTGTVKSHIRRGSVRLRDALAAYLDSEEEATL